VNQKVVTSVLRKNGYEVEVAGDGRQALELLDKSNFDLVLMDIQMPELDGIRTAQKIRQESRWDNLPVIAITAHAMNGDREKCLQAGMNGYLSKPVLPAHLLDVLSEHLNRKASGAALVRPRRSAVGTAQLEEDQELESRMVMLFLQLAPERVRKLHAAAARMDSATLHTQAQKLHKAAERISAVEVARCASQIRDVALGEDYAVIQDHLLKLMHEIGHLAHRYRSRPGLHEEPLAAAGTTSA
ncbi:MAG: response regulator, partial [Acidobacteriia bacterium]|nr:response regulator [Terriglobia bacterium]